MCLVTLNCCKINLLDVSRGTLCECVKSDSLHLSTNSLFYESKCILYRYVFEVLAVRKRFQMILIYCTDDIFEQQSYYFGKDKFTLLFIKCHTDKYTHENGYIFSQKK